MSRSYMSKLCFPGPEEEVFQSDSSQSTITSGGLMLTVENLHDPHTQRKIRDKIRATLKLISFREQRVLVQFWSSHVVGMDQLLTNVDQPYGLTNDKDETLLSYRKISECNVFIDDNDLNPPARVFRRRLPEWTSDLTNYLPKDFPHQECAVRCNLHGYLALPVFDKTTEGLCVGVLELFTSLKHPSFDFEVEQVYNALQKQNLACQQAFDDPALNVPDERKQNEWERIHGLLKRVCDHHNLPLAQTWAAASQSTGIVSHDKVIDKSCSSFDTKCIGKGCMFTTDALPYYAPDLSKWDFMKDCKKRHLEKSKGVVGRAFSSHGLSYCRDVTKLNEDEYPLGILARTYKLTGCIAIFLQGGVGNAEYVLEFFLRPGMEDDRVIKYVVQTLKDQMIEASSGLELGDTSSIQEV